jgi:hypothetical protein
MTNKIEPVSKAAAKFFMSEVAFDTDNEQSSLYPFLLAHNVQLGEVGVDDASFAAFCRAVADQLAPDPYVFGPLLERALRRKCFKTGYSASINKIHNVPWCNLTDEEIDIALKKQDLLGDQEKEECKTYFRQIGPNTWEKVND